MAAPLHLHIANKNYSSWSLRPWVLLKARGVLFEEHVHPFGGPTPFRTFSPSGLVPCLHHGDQVVWDSLAIAEYLAESHDGIWPSAHEARAWARSASAEMHGGFAALREQCSMSCGVRVRLHGIDNALKTDLTRLDALWGDGLDRFGGPFLAGPTFTAADAFFAPVAFRIQSYGLTQLGPASLDYAARLRELPAMRQWYADGLAETWRDPSHDEEVLAWGTVIEDHRASPLGEGARSI